MSDRDRFSKQRSCLYKARYESWAAADLRAGELERRNKKRNHNPHPLHAYECAYCGWWHVGHVPAPKDDDRDER